MYTLLIGIILKKYGTTSYLNSKTYVQQFLTMSDIYNVSFKMFPGTLNRTNLHESTGLFPKEHFN